jgi:hypothetical protein
MRCAWYVGASLVIPDDLADRVVHPAADFVDEVRGLGESTPSFRDRIHEFTGHFSIPFDDKAQHEDEFAFGRELVRLVALRHVDLINLI